LFEAGEELPPERLAFAVAHLEPQQFSAAIGIHAHGEDDRAGADLQRLAQPSVQVVGVEVEVRVTATVEWPLQDGLARAEAPESALGMVRRVEVVLKPGKWVCRPLATTDASGVHAQARLPLGSGP
jgi:hypothetical protein